MAAAWAVHGGWARNRDQMYRQRVGEEVRMKRRWPDGCFRVREYGKTNAALPEEHAEALLNPDSPYSIVPLARYAASFGAVLPQLLKSFSEGGGVGWGAYGPDAIEAQGDFNRPWLRGQLASEYLPAIPDVHERLIADPPAKVLDMASGVGWCGIKFIQHRQKYTGYHLRDFCKLRCCHPFIGVA